MGRRMKKSKELLRKEAAYNYILNNPDMSIYSKELAYSDGFNKGFLTAKKLVLEELDLQKTKIGYMKKSPFVWIVERLGF